MKSLKGLGGDFSGALADSAILLPLIFALSRSGGMNGSALLLTAGLAYLAAGVFFRVPMSVQPLKSIAIAGVSAGASSEEIRWAGFLLGCFCLLAYFGGLGRWANRVPKTIVESIQFGLGILLILQGVKIGGELPSAQWLWIFLLTLAMTLGPRLTSWPVLGWVATAGVLLGSLHPESATHLGELWKKTGNFTGIIRPTFILSLLLPQLALTSANSVLGTEAVAHRYFGKRAERVTASNLFVSIGLGNVLAAAAGGLPFCHGSGGLTAHFRGGASHWRMNLIAAFSFIFLAVWTYFHGQFAMPPLLVAALLITTGFFHLALARECWSHSLGRIRLLFAAFLTYYTRNLLATLAGVLLLECFLGLARSRNEEVPS